MKYVVGLVLLLSALAAGNPVLVTFVNEFGFDGDGLGWVELHAEPSAGDVDMTGWLLTTSTSICTLAYYLPVDGFLIVDSASLAGGQYGRGTFRLNPAGDHITVLTDEQYSDEVEFPLLPAGQGRAPTPPNGGSVSVLNVSGAWMQTINWYIDSTPTPEQDNDDYSTVTGVVTWASGRGFYEVDVVASGPMGSTYCALSASGQTYETPGLGAGRYAVTAHGWPGGETVSYPESVDVGYSQTLPDINLHFDSTGVEESGPLTAYSSQPTATVLTASGLKRLARSVVFDAMGRRVVNPKPGVYFVMSEPSAVSRQPSAVFVRKVVIAR
jgi:hypothetical protein